MVVEVLDLSSRFSPQKRLDDNWNGLINVENENDNGTLDNMRSLPCTLLFSGHIESNLRNRNEPT